MMHFKTIALVTVIVGFVGANDRAFSQDAKAAEQRLADLERQIVVIQEEIRALQERLQPKRMSEAVRLRNASAVETVEALSRLLGGKERGIQLVAEPVSNSILVSAPSDIYGQVIRLLSAIDAFRSCFKTGNDCL